MDRRAFLFGTVAGAAGLAATAARADLAVDLSDLRGTITGETLSLDGGATDDQSARFQKAIDEAAASGRPLFLPPGRYEVSNVRLPSRLQLTGVPGATRIVYSGGGRFLTAQGGSGLVLQGLLLDGANRPLGDDVPALLHLLAVDDLTLDRLEVIGSGRNAVGLEGCSGRVTACRLTGARAAGLWSIAGRGLSVVDNHVADCGDGGILVHRWQDGEDGTLVSRNRIERIAARSGGSGQVGNGISLYRAHGVIISDNQVADCAFSAIRTHASGNVQISGNRCTRSGEAAIRAEAGLDGGLVTGNVVDTATLGIAVTDAGDGARLASVSGNLVRNLAPAAAAHDGPPLAGVGIAVETDTAVTGNVIESAPALGVLVGWGAALRNVVATGNMIRDARTGIGVSVVDGVGPATIAANVIDGAPNGAVRGMRFAEFVTGDLAFDGAGSFPHLTIGENRVG